MPAPALLLATLETKAAERDHLAERLTALGIEHETIDVSLGSGGAAWTAERKMAALEQAVAAAAAELRARPVPPVAIGIGGGTGAAIILRALRALPALAPKILISPLPFDPRPHIADSAVVLVPTLEDVCGLTPGLRAIIEQVAHMAAGVSAAPAVAPPAKPAVAVSLLGVTGKAGEQLLALLHEREVPAAVYHANGYGGAAFVRGVAEGRIGAVIDLTVHELTRVLLGGDHAPQSERFSAAGRAGLPQVVLPGGLNFIGLNDYASVSAEHRARPHYRHSDVATHVGVTTAEMEKLARALLADLNQAQGPLTLLVPMGGFSAADAPGGALENPELRKVFEDIAQEAAQDHIDVVSVPEHINDAAVAEQAIERLASYNSL